jgi:UTP:GlnB (protein PII) uridylyltransferase
MEGSDHIRLTVVAGDRPGLLADTAAVLASEGLSILTASAATWTAEGLAMHALTFAPDGPFDDARWAVLSARLQELRDDNSSATSVAPAGVATVRVHGAHTGRAVVAVTAPDRLGLLWAICRWFADHDVSIESMSATTDGGVAHDTFIVIGDCDGAELARHLSRGSNRGCLASPFLLGVLPRR